MNRCIASRAPWVISLSFLALGLVLWSPKAGAEVLHSRQSALKLAFPSATSVTPRNVFLSQAEVGRIQSQAGARPDSRMITLYVGRDRERCIGYAFFDTHRVRTKTQTLLIVLNPRGQVQAVHVLAFFEPREYLPRARWLEQLKGRGLSPRLHVGYEIAAVAGATMTNQAVVQSVRRALALHGVALGDGSRVGCSAPTKER